MSEFNIASESVDVERIMEQIRSRIREKRGEDYTEEQIRELANVKLERFLNPKNVRSDLAKHYREHQDKRGGGNHEEPSAPPEIFEFNDDTIYRSSRGLPGKILYVIRRFLNPLLKFFFNPAPITNALHIQQQLNERYLVGRDEIDRLNYELMNNLVVEMTRLAIEMKNLRMRVESISARLDFDERRARALEGVVQYRQESTGAAGSSSEESATSGSTSGNPNRRRRRRRGGRRSPGPAKAAATSDSGASSKPIEPRAPTDEAPQPTSEKSPPVGGTGAPSSEKSTPPGEPGTPEQ